MADGEGVLPRPFGHPDVTADGSKRAGVAFDRLETLWINTGSLCNIECAHCYIESSPANDRLEYISLAACAPFLDEAAAMGGREIGFTGGEPFLNPDMPAMLEAALARGFSALVLTNAMRPMMRPRIKAALSALNARFPRRLRLRVSLDHYERARHDGERGAGGFEKSLEGVGWLVEQGFDISIAARTRWGETEKAMRRGFAALFTARHIPLDAMKPEALVLFPEMDEHAPVPEITESCWGILGKDPGDMMCATARMVIQRKGAPRPVVLSCTLLAYEEAFELGETLHEAARPVKLNHPHCARFCVLGGASCSG